ncbi:thiolase family protein [uncultured Meiothermus sp.]|uniref:thiolase family protein n=1 Tax=uncultured Meiothermus sp. TaxID=157471 RepID=UPI002638F9CB|nr:thiolase family protein [uncultured Meiothermus sp.]
MSEVVILSAVRTPIGQIRGSLSGVRPDDLAGMVIKAAVERAGVEGRLIEEVFFGCANQAGEDNRNVARMGALLAGLPYSVAGVTVNRLCASGLSAINQAARAIRSGEGEVYVAGGVESMTRAPYVFAKNAQPFGPSGNITGFDTTLGWRFPNPAMEAGFPLEAMGETAENIVEMSQRGEIKGGEITRADQDRFALQSQARAVNAIQNGYFKNQIVPVPVPGKKGSLSHFDTDEFPRYTRTEQGYELSTSMEQLGQLKPAFRAGGSVTAGNSSGLSDGAAALVLMSDRKAQELGLKPLARWVGSAVAGVSPRVMGLGPIGATRKVLTRTGIAHREIDLVELNEAFAAQAIAVLRELELSEAITNVNGGAIALGHPLGCSGARISTTLIHELHRRKDLGQQARYGLATLCVGVGQGEATIFERL